MKSRSVWVWLFPALALSFLLLDYRQYGTMVAAWQNMGMNLCFLLLQLLLVTAWFSAKNRQWVWITDQLIGWGDILFLVSITAYFSLINYVLFYLLSLLIILTGYLVSELFFKKADKRIPLAGLQAAALGMVMIAHEQWNWLEPGNDNWLLKFWR